ncbi:regulator of hemoglobinization and erythroid cell expansion protein [Colius striatus]|uniref:regulator of hemoglobinization and erythroid cell expansion protein n=1 Tax=Colius striatus TaxID=57412 RepID=UPI0005297615|nr:regulator of hemoglobinization and erythroid cell expansion protein [Colius striatus]
MSGCEWWMLVATSAVTLILYALLLLTLYIMLSRKIGKQASGSPTAQPLQPLQPPQPPSSSAGGEGAPRLTYAGSSDTSSETSEDSDSSPSCPQGPCSRENLNYTSLVFPAKGHGPGPAGDYENMKTGVDYVNVDPKKRKVDFWSCSSPVASKSIEYTEVKL